jgi:hypothetical protein
MTNINLYQSSTETKNEKKKMTLLDSGFFWSLAMLLIVIIAFAGLKFVSNNLKNKSVLLENEIIQGNATFAGSDLNRIVDFKARLDESMKNISSKLDTGNVFSAVESSIVRGVYVVSFSLDNKDNGLAAITLDLVARDFSLAAKQILSFKENDSFENVSVIETSRDEDGVAFKIMADIK